MKKKCLQIREIIPENNRKLEEKKTKKNKTQPTTTLFQKSKSRHPKGPDKGYTLHFLSEMLANNNEQEGTEGKERGEQLQITPL